MGITERFWYVLMQRNYRFFYLFISSSTFLCMYVFTFSWLNIVGRRHHYGSIWKSMLGEVLSLLLIIYTFISVWFVGGLRVFHSYLICSNQVNLPSHRVSNCGFLILSSLRLSSQTTYENFRYRYEKRKNPYNKGILTNLISLFFSKIPPSMINFRSWVLPEALLPSLSLALPLSLSLSLALPLSPASLPPAIWATPNPPPAICQRQKQRRSGNWRFSAKS